MDICPDKGWQLFFLTAQKTFNTRLVLDCFLFYKSYFRGRIPETSSLQIPLQTAQTMLSGFCHVGKENLHGEFIFLMVWMAPEVEVEMETLYGTNLWHGSGVHGVDNHSSQLVQFCGVLKVLSLEA